MRYASVFSGVEAATLAWEPLGWEPVCFSEVDPFPSSVLAHRYPDVPNLGDITKINWKMVRRKYGQIDLVVGGSPCQSFSVAGTRTGLQGASGLMWEYVRCVREVMPRWLLWENVPGALSSSHGEDFRCLLESLDACGYGLAWRVLDAQFFGVAQRRERVFLVGHLGDVEGPCEVLFEPESLRWDTPTSREKRQELAAGAGVGAACAGFHWNAGGKTALSVGETSPTVTSSDPPAVCAGFKWHQGSGAGSIGLENEQPPTLTADYHNPAVICIPENAINRPTGGTNGPMAYGEGEPSPTLRASKDVPAVMCMTDTQPNSMVSGEVCGALSATMHKDPPVAMALRMRSGSEGGGKGALVQEDVSGALSASPGMKQTTYAAQCYSVRRLTPLECERLQGMPDGHTKVPYRGKPADECPDTPRYRAIGNSMAVPVMRWIGERIVLADGDSDMDYETFLKGKRADTPPDGFPVSVEMSPLLFDWQRAIVEWACRRGRACIFADCGLGKTAMQLEWARQEAASCDGSVLVLTPLAVAAQTVEEGRKFGISAEYVRDMPESPRGVYVTNYEMMRHFDLHAFSGVVLDESSILKSHDSKTRNALTEALRDVPHVLCCTATPAPNDQMELGTHAEICGAMTRSEMLATFFTHDGGDTSKWRLKGHAEADFYRWMAGWAVMISSPADIGYSAEGYDLPELKVTEVNVETPDVEADDGRLFALPAQGLTDARRARRESMPYKVEAIAEAVNSTPGQWCVWCELNDESAALADAIPDAVEVRGSDSPEHKADAMLGFAEGRYRVIVSKPSICGFGMNWQGCHQMAFCGLSYSYEQFYQATRRCWRFGQESDVDVYVFSTAMESDVVATIRRKEETMAETKRGMVEAMAEETERQLSGDADDDLPDCMFADAEGDGWQMLLGDCVERIAEIPDCSVGLSVFSPPFASLYTYSDSERDMGNCRTDEEFWGHFSYLIPELYRVLMPGRSVCIHCMNLPRTKERDGVIGIRDFRGDIIRAFERAGFVYHSEVCIWKDPVTAMQRTKALGLLHKTIRKDSSMSRQGIPDYVVVMRKPGQNTEPISHTSDEFPVSLWQRWASPVWSDINQSRTLNGRNARENGDERHICPLQLDVIERCVGLWSNPGDLVLSPFAGIGSEGYQSVLMGREFIGIELKPSYFRAAVVNLREVESQAKQQSLF